MPGSYNKVQGIFELNGEYVRIESSPVAVNPGTMGTQAATTTEQSIQLQSQEVLTALRNHPASGRLAIAIDSDISKWENTAADIELCAGDTLLIPKRPNFVVVRGQVYNPVAIGYVPRRDLDWYLEKAGGSTRTGDKKHIYVLRADGSVVVPRDEQSIWMGGSFKNARMQPGDTIFVPEKIIGSLAEHHRRGADHVCGYPSPRYWRSYLIQKGDPPAAGEAIEI